MDSTHHKEASKIGFIIFGLTGN